MSRILGVALLCILAFLRIGLPDQSLGATVPTIVVSVEPLALIVRELCDQSCEVMTLVPAGVSEHSWQPGPKEYAKIKDSLLLVGVGLDFDSNWIKKSNLQSKKIIWLAEQLSPMGWWSDELIHATPGEPRHRAEAHHSERQGSLDPHIWTDAGRMSNAVKLIAAKLSAEIPKEGPAIDLRVSKMVSRFRQVELDVSERRKAWRTRPVAMFHDSAGYFGRKFDLPILTVSPGAHGHELSPRIASQMIEKFRSAGVVAIFVERKDGFAKTFARELGVKVQEFDFAGIKSYKTWDDWYLAMASAWEAALR